MSYNHDDKKTVTDLRIKFDRTLDKFVRVSQHIETHEEPFQKYLFGAGHRDF